MPVRFSGVQLVSGRAAVMSRARVPRMGMRESMLWRGCSSAQSLWSLGNYMVDTEGSHHKRCHTQESKNLRGELCAPEVALCPCGDCTAHESARRGAP